MSRRVFVLLLGLAAIVAPALAQQPAELDRWRGWVLERHAEFNCVTLSGSSSSRQCAWPSDLVLEVGQNRASFSQRWDILAESRVSLPGDAEDWPVAVRIGGREAAVYAHDGRPALTLAPGSHRVSGEFHWKSPPQSLQLPPGTGLLRLTHRGQLVAQPMLEGTTLWLRRPAAATPAGEAGDSVQLEVFRKLGDGVPQQLDTRITLSVSGKPRELLLGRALPAGVELSALESDLPARIESDGRLRVQVRAGQWPIRLVGRYREQTDRFSFERLDPAWPEQELWSYQTAPSIRGTRLTGAPAVDPSQTRLPANWRRLPAYRLSSADTLQLEERWRGDVAPPANELHLSRQIWLDFDGLGGTVRDEFSGRMNQGWRLQAAPGLALGRVSVNGEPQLVTRHNGETGVEIRQRQLQLDAVSRVDAFSELAAVGWRQDVKSLQMQLHLPPGWRLWHVGGADTASQSWVSDWNLWDVFICLLLVAVVGRLIGPGAGCLAAATLLLTYHIAGALLVGWLLLAGLLPLLRWLEAGRFFNAVALTVGLTLFSLTLHSLSFSVQQLREAIFPQLEFPMPIRGQDGRGGGRELARRVAGEAADRSLSKSSLPAMSEYAASDDAAAPPERPRKYAPEPVDNVQTGPGEPQWRWRSVQLGWNGPVSAGERLDLYLSPPGWSRLLNVVNVVLIWSLLVWLALALLASARGKFPARPAPPSGGLPGTALGIGLLGALTLPGAVDALEYPPPELLTELEQRLTRAPLCEPACAAITRSRVSIGRDRLDIRLRVDAAAKTAIALPSATAWRPDSVLRDGAAEVVLARRDKHLWLALEAGSHQIDISGAAPGDSYDVTFFQKPHNLQVEADGWSAEGLTGRGGLQGRTLALRRLQPLAGQDTLQSNSIAPLASVTRALSLDVDWTLETVVRRIAPASGSVTLSVPLLPGESVVSRDVSVVDGHVQVALAPGQQQTRWRSLLAPQSRLALTAAGEERWVERWRLDASPRWHITTEGLAPVRPSSRGGRPVSTWMPWPGERLTIRADRLAPVVGATVTVESARARFTPGERSSTLALHLLIRSSMGGDYSLALEEEAVLQRLQIDGREQTLPMTGKALSIPLRPGEQRVDVEWKVARGVESVTRTPSISLAGDAANIAIDMTLPRSRWPLFLWGPAIGPAFLYWGVLIVILCAAPALGWLQRRQGLSIPLTTWTWLLLLLGMSTVNLPGSLPVALWFFALEARQRFANRLAAVSMLRFRALQVALVLLSLVALASLFSTIPQGLLSTPDMQVAGNGSGNFDYHWYQDRSGASLPQAAVFSLSLWVYRLVMLLWSLWLALAVVRWAAWGWRAISRGGFWRRS